MVKKLETGARIILGLIYFVFGGMGLLMALGVIHPPTPAMTPGAEAFFKGIMGSGYFFPLLKAAETICGLMLLMNIAAPLALVILAPITLHIFLFHLFLTPGMNELPLPIGMVMLQIIAMLNYWGKYRSLFSK